GSDAVPSYVRRESAGPAHQQDRPRHTAVLVELGSPRRRKTRAPMTGKNILRLCKGYGRLIGYPELKPHELPHGVAMEVLEQHHDLEQVRALLGHARIDTTQIYTSIRPPQLKRAVSFYEEQATRMLVDDNETRTTLSVANRRARNR